MVEIWKSVLGYEGLYEASSFGRIRSVKRTTFRISKKDGRKIEYPIKERFLASTITNRERNGSPRLKVTLCKDGIPRTKHVHIIVCEAFHGRRPDGMLGCHKDGSPMNNHAENLKWGTHADNSADSVRHGTSTKGTRNPKAKLDEAGVLKIRDEAARAIRRKDIASRFGISLNQVRMIVTRQHWKHVV